MNKFLAILLLVFSFTVASLTVNAAALHSTNHASVISIDPLDLLFEGRITATYEQKLSTRNSFTVNAIFWNHSKDAFAFGVGGSYRWYFDLFEEGKSSLNGLSIGPRLDFLFWDWAGNDEKKAASFSTLALGGEVNYKWVFDGKWSVEPTIKFVIPVLRKSGYSYTNHGVGVNLGYCF